MNKRVFIAKTWTTNVKRGHLENVEVHEQRYDLHDRLLAEFVARLVEVGGELEHELLEEEWT